jgi:aspartyl-tRNA(Asn)/glutamyl-tRNA(Gln) amidotransferase subunit A
VDVTGGDPSLLTIVEAQRELGSGTLSTVELTEAVLARVDALNPKLNAYLLDAEGAVRQAQALERVRNRGALHGIPVCVKDVIDVQGLPTTAGAAGWRRDPTRDAGAVARLREAGAVVIGKGNTNEFAYGIDGLNPHWGDCRNPRKPSRISGGSSSGPAVATSTGMALAGVGTDTSGSIRVPASLCGLVGIRPTLARISTSGVVPLAWSYDTVGLLARSVQDAAILLEVAIGRDDLRPPSDAEVRGLRLGVIEDLVAGSEPYVAEGIADLRDGLEELGAEVVPLDLDMLRYAGAMHRVVQQAEAARVHAPWFDAQRDRYAESVRQLLEAGRLIPAPTYLAAQQARRVLIDEVARAMTGVDAMLAPSTPLVAPPRDATEVRIRDETVPLRPALLRCVVPTSELGSSVVSVPVGSHNGLPFGLQIIGRPYSEALLLRIAAACERCVVVPALT